ncbi:MAG: Gfo/Idh/MocA family oxidoreductase [Bryobacterales bacterium]|nr:Gfo/Idh/MocA family oxidoreductase [Bryobacterales bacterium]
MSRIEPVPVAVVGAGRFGQHHARVYASLPEADLVGVVDSDLDRAREIAARHGCEAYPAAEALPDSVCAASLAVPTVCHAPVGDPLLNRGVDLLVEKPIAPDLDSADQLIAAAENGGRILQVGHLERFNPIVEAAAEAATLPLFFEVHRMSPFSPRSLDIDVVLDLMIHDLDIVRSMVDSDVDKVDASGLSVVSGQADIASARIQFENGCVANLTASRVSTEKIRKLRFFQPREYVSLDYVRRTGVRITLDDRNRPRFRTLPAGRGEPLQRQLSSFLASVRDRSQPRVSGRDAREALGLALRIGKAIGEHSRLVAKTLAASGRIG